MAKRSLADARILITGASSGIGRALALALAGEGARLIVNARREEKLRELAQDWKGSADHLALCPGDITLFETRAAALEMAKSRFGGLDILVNNAGVGAIGRFEHAAPERLRQVMELNFFALVEMTRLALPVLSAGLRPMIVNVGSILGRRGSPRSSEYCASKFAVQGFSESLRAELASKGIDVLMVNPGTTESEFMDRLIEKKGDTTWTEQPKTPAADVARATIAAMRKGKHEIIPNARGRLLCWLNRLSPRAIDALMARYG